VPKLFQRAGDTRSGPQTGISQLSYKSPTLSPYLPPIRFVNAAPLLESIAAQASAWPHTLLAAELAIQKHTPAATTLIKAWRHSTQQELRLKVT